MPSGDGRLSFLATPMRNSVRFALCGILTGIVAPLGLVLYALLVDRTIDPMHLFAVMVVGGGLSLGVAGYLFGRQKDELTEQNQALRALSERLQALSSTDALTGIPNRRALDERLPGELGRTSRHGTPLALVMMDLDHFKRLNDRYGHVAGDAVLRQVAHILDSEKRRGDFVSRYGGEEFVAVLPHADSQAAERWAERVRARIAGTAIDNGQALLRVTASFGVAAADGNEARATPTPQELLSAADRALYLAKAGGRDQVIVDGGPAGRATESTGSGPPAGDRRASRKVS
jgi:diguanylate cyclase (GGDEF)-like protein